MAKIRWAVVFAFILASAHAAQAAQGLVIHSEESGVGKFHRLDNKNHPYASGSAWAPYVIAENANTTQTFTQDNADGSVTVVFTTLDDLLASVVRLSQERKLPVSVLNVHGHGLPGGMWFPKDAETRDGLECYDWVNAANGADQANYDQYYSAVSASEIRAIRDMSNATNEPSMGCVSGLSAWQGAVAKNPAFKSALADDVQVHFLSCVVGLGRAGETFTQGVAALLLKPGSSARVETSMNFGLGDWSMPAGMGFWDYLTDDQLNHDNSIYPVDRKDAEIAQKGTIRMVASSEGKWASQLLGDRDVMSVGFETQIFGTRLREPAFAPEAFPRMPARVRVPGTAAYVHVVR